MDDHPMSLAAPFYVSPTGKRAIYYHTSWSCYDRNYQVKDLPIDKITDIAYAFFNVASDGTVASGDAWADFQNPLVGKGVPPENSWDSPADHLGNLGQFMKLRKAGKKFNMALSIGGWSWSGKFSDAVSTVESRDKMAQCILNTFKAWPGLFNGVSIDWEYCSDDGVNYGLEGNLARKGDAVNLMQFVKRLRKVLGDKFKIGVCVSADPAKIKLPVQKLHPLVDEIHVMTYDFMDGAWGLKTSGHHTNLRPAPYCPFSVTQAVEAWSSKGVPKEKLFIGVAFYSRGFAATTGIGQACNGASPDKSWDNGSVDYKSLPLPGAVEKWDAVAQASYSYDSKKRVINSYDCPRSVAAKCKYVLDEGLGGILVWESSGDHAWGHPRCLMKVIHDNLTHASIPKPAPTPPTPAPTPPKPAPTPPKPAPTPPKPASPNCPCTCHV